MASPTRNRPTASTSCRGLSLVTVLVVASIAFVVAFSMAALTTSELQLASQYTSA